MNIKALRSFMGEEGRVRRGQILKNVAAPRAAALVKKGLAAELTAREAAGRGKVTPTGRGRAGRRTGGAKPASSSPAGRAPGKQG